MRTSTIGLGIALTTLGVASYFGTGRASKTALIPAAFGVPLVVLGALDRGPLRPVIGRVATTVAALGLAGSAPGLRKLPALLTEGRADRPAAVLSQSAMAILCGGYAAARLVQGR